ncbi:MAG TPA: stage V sporulation protein R, partial [Bacillota bacterium]|nr:stage V sporulation protein R [Bacillota bacterium]
NGELYLKHEYEGIELDSRYTEKTLPNLFLLWGRPVHLETVLEGKPVQFTFNGERNIKKFL